MTLPEEQSKNSNFNLLQESFNTSRTVQSDDKRIIYVNCKPSSEKYDRTGRLIYSYPENKIRTAKYSLFSFIPKNLFEQFRRLANFYFLAMVILQWIPMFSIANKFLAAVPITFIVLVTAVKDAFEDMKRHNSDREINNSQCKILNDLPNDNHQHLDRVTVFWLTVKFAILDQWTSLKQAIVSKCHDQQRAFDRANMRPSPMTSTAIDRNIFGDTDFDDGLDAHKANNNCMWISIPWRQLRVGDIIYLSSNETIPADVLILSSSEPDSLCYVETKNLDGETNLKIRSGMAETAWIQSPLDVHDIRYAIEVELPNTNLYSFKGTVHIPQNANKGLVKSVSSPQQGLRTSRMISQEQATASAKIPITSNEVLLRGCVLRNTEWIIGVVIYTGADTKLIMNSGETPSKRSDVDKKTNIQVLANFILLITLCTIIAIGNALTIHFSQTPSSSADLTPQAARSQLRKNPFMSGFIAFWSSLVLLQNLVPISLYITTELVKSFQAYFIFCDIEMYYEQIDTTCIPKTWTIADDLGQIEYVFSDKTGTLTKNVMEFRKCSINGVSYGGYHSKPDESEEATETFNTYASAESLMVENLLQISQNPYKLANLGSKDDMSFVDYAFAKDLSQTNSEQSRKINEFFTHLAVCHTVLSEYPDETNDLVIKYNAQSPDEAALVATARDCGFVFLDRDQESIFLNIQGTPRKYKFLNVIEFSSARKRMSVIVETDQGEIKLFCKGADSVIYERLSPGQNIMKEITLEHLENFANDGLRTLCLASRNLNVDEYEEWAADYREASISMIDREKQMEQCAEKIEVNLQLLGATAIEDELQEGVPETIRSISQAGIKVWVLTGDKLETAINIGFSCHLLTEDMILIVIRGSDFHSTKAQIEEALIKCFNQDPLEILGPDSHLEESTNSFTLDGLPRVSYGQSAHDETHEHAKKQKKKRIYSLIIDGESLKYALDRKIEKLLLRLGCICKAVICCRVSPLQKAQVVALVRFHKKALTLAIGDGANDVSMIHAANVGIGIMGQEGRQAVMASDYAIAQFKYLKRLLLVHGRWSYFRTAQMTLLMFYKTITWAMIPFWYQIFSGWSTQLPWNYFFIMTYNILFTVLPPIVIGVLDQDISAERSMLAPAVYVRGISRELYGVKLIITYTIDGLYQSLVCFFIAYNCATSLSSNHRDGREGDINHFGTLAATLAILNVNIYMALNSLHWTWIHFLSFFGGIVAFFTVTMLYAVLASAQLFAVLLDVLRSPVFWLTIPLSIVACNMPRYVIKFVEAYLIADDIDIVREMEKYHLEDEWQKSIKYFEATTQTSSDQLERDRRRHEMRPLTPLPTTDQQNQDGSPAISPEIIYQSPPVSPVSVFSSSSNHPSSLVTYTRRPEEWLTTTTTIARRHTAESGDEYTSRPHKASEMMFMTTGKQGRNTGFAFSQEPGLASHLRQMSGHERSAKKRREKHLSAQSMMTILPEHFRDNSGGGHERSRSKSPPASNPSSPRKTHKHRPYSLTRTSPDITLDPRASRRGQTLSLGILGSALENDYQVSKGSDVDDDASSGLSVDSSPKLRRRALTDENDAIEVEPTKDSNKGKSPQKKSREASQGSSH